MLYGKLVQSRSGRFSCRRFDQKVVKLQRFAAPTRLVDRRSTRSQSISAPLTFTHSAETTQSVKQEIQIQNTVVDLPNVKHRTFRRRLRWGVVMETYLSMALSVPITRKVELIKLVPRIMIDTVIINNRHLCTASVFIKSPASFCFTVSLDGLDTFILKDQKTVQQIVVLNENLSFFK